MEPNRFQWTARAHQRHQQWQRPFPPACRSLDSRLSNRLCRSPGGGGMPSSPKEGWFGKAPESSTPMITPLPKLDPFTNPPCRCSPRNAGVCVVSLRSTLCGRADTKPSLSSMASTSSSVSLAANPLMEFL